MQNQSLSVFKNKKVLVMGLGLLGGGVATTKWLVKHGAKVTVTDLRSRQELGSSIKALGVTAKKVKFVLGRHRRQDFKTSEIVVVNPAVPRESLYLKVAKRSGAQLENEASLFFRFCKNPIIAVTGTRGKTTTVNWIYHILKRKSASWRTRVVLTGNSSENPMLKFLDGLDGKSPVVLELSSWHLELLSRADRGPHVAVVTNIYPDHLNRYRSMKDYVMAKVNIFGRQTKDDFLVLNRENAWTGFLLRQKPKSRVVYFPAKIPINRKYFEQMYGAHNVENLMAATVAAHLFGVPKSLIKDAIRTLPSLPYREEVIIKKDKLVVINDTTATTPEAAIYAIERFRKKGTVVLIAGGSDKKLDFKNWAQVVKRNIKPENLFLIDGSATKKMVRELKKLGYFLKGEPKLFEELLDLLKAVRDTTESRHIILFSPAATSFEKFQNEFDRGRQFNLYSKKLFA
ncbi:MAG: UDP-N-acetylmuramoyl-L-alanine--D-glutamate ligase [Patescibacteria group bacterium]|nr:UDP-N-acetylmuramoyl-L-alanine--D-glutamate ligase [Patescibacteria group bacterium]